MGLFFNQDVWEKYYIIPFKCSRSTDIQWFQYRILHHIYTRYKFNVQLLSKIGYIENDKCTFCGIHPETIPHIFFDCNIVHDFWEAINGWLRNNVNKSIPLEKEIILFGMQGKEAKILNWLILKVKRYIYSIKIIKNRLNIFALLKVIQVNLVIERYLLLKNCKYKEFNCYWSPWLKLL